MATPNLDQQMTNDINSIQAKIGGLQERVRLTKSRDAVGELQSAVHNLTQRITSARTRGYIFEKDMET